MSVQSNTSWSDTNDGAKTVRLKNQSIGFMRNPNSGTVIGQQHVSRHNMFDRGNNQKTMSLVQNMAKSKVNDIKVKVVRSRRASSKPPHDAQQQQRSKSQNMYVDSSENVTTIASKSMITLPRTMQNNNKNFSYLQQEDEGLSPFNDAVSMRNRQDHATHLSSSRPQKSSAQDNYSNKNVILFDRRQTVDNLISSTPKNISSITATQQRPPSQLAKQEHKSAQMDKQRASRSLFRVESANKSSGRDGGPRAPKHQSTFDVTQASPRAMGPASPLRAPILSNMPQQTEPYQIGQIQQFLNVLDKQGNIRCVKVIGHTSRPTSGRDEFVLLPSSSQISLQHRKDHFDEELVFEDSLRITTKDRTQKSYDEIQLSLDDSFGNPSKQLLDHHINQTTLHPLSLKKEISHDSSLVTDYAAPQTANIAANYASQPKQQQSRLGGRMVPGGKTIQPSQKQTSGLEVISANKRKIQRRRASQMDVMRTPQTAQTTAQQRAEFEQNAGASFGGVMQFVGDQIKSILAGDILAHPDELDHHYGAAPNFYHLHPSQQLQVPHFGSAPQQPMTPSAGGGAFGGLQQNIFHQRAGDIELDLDESRQLPNEQPRDENRLSAQFGTRQGSGRKREVIKITQSFSHQQHEPQQTRVFNQTPSQRLRSPPISSRNVNSSGFGVMSSSSSYQANKQMVTQLDMNQSVVNSNATGWSADETLSLFGKILTEFEKIEITQYQRIYTTGRVRRFNQYSISNQDGQYLFQVGEQIGYRYEIVKLIDKGAFGQVIQCVDCSQAQRTLVALKLSKNKKFDVDNAHVEINILQKLSQPHYEDDEGRTCLVYMIDNFMFRQSVVIVFECLSANLYTYQKMNKFNKCAFTKRQLKSVSRQVCAGLKFMRNKGIIHCDIKPENILFTDNSYNRVKIIDFGASCADCSTGFFYVQSRYYRAPEIVLGIEYDHAVDMWSLGCILYELVVGSPIFPAKDENELLEYFYVTLGAVPNYMIKAAKKQKEFYYQSSDKPNFFELKRSHKSSFRDSDMKPRSQTIDHLLKNQADHFLIDFIKKCLVYDPEDRLTPETGLHHAWLLDDQDYTDDL